MSTIGHNQSHLQKLGSLTDVRIEEISKKSLHDKLNFLASTDATIRSADEERKSITQIARDKVDSTNKEYRVEAARVDSLVRTLYPEIIEEMGTQATRMRTDAGAMVEVVGELVGMEYDISKVSLNQLMQFLTPREVDTLLRRAHKAKVKVRGVKFIREKILRFRK